MAIASEQSRPPRSVSLFLLIFLFSFTSFIPSYYLPPVTVNVGPLNVPFLKYLSFIPICLLILLWITEQIIEKGKNIQRTPLDALIFSFLLVNLASVFKTEHLFLSIVKLTYYTLTGIVLYYITYYSLRNDSQNRHFVSSIIFVSSTVALYGVSVYLLGQDPLWGDYFVQYNPYHKDTNRVASSIGNPIPLGSYLILCFPLCLYRLINSHGFSSILTYATAGFIMLLCILLTYSRGAWLGIIVTLGVYAIIKWRSNPLFLNRGKVIVAIIVVLLSMPIFSTVMNSIGLGYVQDKVKASIFVRTEALLNLTDTEKFRLAQYGTTLDVLRQHPVLGIGFGSFTEQFEKYKHHSTPPRSVSDATTTENMYLMFACETGVVGLIVSLGLLYRLLVTIYRESKLCQGELLIALFAGFCGFLVDIVTWDALNYPPIRVTFWILAGLAMAIIQPLNSTHGRQCAKSVKIPIDIEPVRFEGYSR